VEEKEKKVAAKKRKPMPPEKYFKTAASIWISIYGELVPPDKETGEVADPGFWTNGPDKRHLKLILIELRLRAEKKNIEWTEEEMGNRLRLFLHKAWEDDFISKNFMLRIINNCRTKIFNNQITPKRNAGAKENIRSVGRTLDFDKP